MTENIIEVERVTKRFRNLLAIDNLSLTVETGEVLGLIGPDGAGKTTILRLIAAIMEPTSGRITVAGYDTLRQPEEIKKRIGYMPQHFGLYSDLSVMENLNFFADIFELSRGEREPRIARLLAFSRLSEFAKRPAGQLSGGMQKKLALACSLLHQPKLLLLDEPTTGVDAISRREFWEILAELHLSGVTLIVSTPYMDEAERCSRVGLVFQGQLIACDEPEAVKQLVVGDLIQLRATDLRGAMAALSGEKGILEVRIYGELLHVLVIDGAQGMRLIADKLAQKGITVQDLRHTKPRMEDSFVSLIKRRLTVGEGGGR